MMKLTPHQKLATSGARCVCTFTIGDRLYVAFPQLAVDIEGDPPNMNGGNSDTVAVIYQWQNNQFELFQELPLHGGEHIDFALIDGKPTLAIANIRKGKMPNFDTSVPTQIFHWNGQQFELHQKIPSYASKSTCLFHHQEKDFLLISEGVIESEADKDNINHNHLYCWQNNEFSLYQSLDTKWGYDTEFFIIDNQAFLAIGDNIQSSKIYIWRNEKFELFQEFSTHGGGRGFCHFEIDDQHYVAFANLLHNSELYRWDGKQFDLIKTFEGAGTRSFHHAKIENQHFLFKTNFITGTREAPITQQEATVFQWQNEELIPVASYPTFGGTDAKTFSDNGNHYLIVSNSLSEDIRFRVDSMVYKINV